MDRTIQALTDLSTVDDQLSGRAAPGDGHALEKRRAALRDAIPETFLAAYDALGRAGRRPVIVPVRGAHCGGCYLRLPPKLDSSLRRRQSLCSCPHCRRLLYSRLAEPGEATTSKPGPDRPATTGRKTTRTRPSTEERRARKLRAAGGRDDAPRRGVRRGGGPPVRTNPVERSLRP